MLVHAVRHAEELTYRDEIGGDRRGAPGCVHVRAVVSRGGSPARCPGRIPRLIADGRLEARAGIALSPENSQVMLCGNPAMIEDTQKVLAPRGMRRHRRREPGHITRRRVLVDPERILDEPGAELSPPACASRPR